jgi:hypothetical protein
MRLAAALFAVSIGALAQEAAPKADVGTNVKDPVIDFYDSMSDYFRQNNRAIHLIREKGIPDPEIPAVLFIARRSSASPNQVIDAKKGGKSWEEIAKQNGVKFEGTDLVAYANTVFLTDYHGRTPEEVRALREKGASFIEIDQEFRRVGASKRQTERTRTK